MSSGQIVKPHFNQVVAQPKVVFVGDWITYGWPLNNPNWINKGLPGNTPQSGPSTEVLARFQADVVSLHPNIVHIMVGSSDAELSDDAFFATTTPAFLQAIEGMVAAAKAANIKVIFGLEPQYGSYATSVELFNSLVVSYAAQNNIPVINYGDALCQCVGSTSFDASTTVSPLNPYLANEIITPAGYALMTQMATAAIGPVGATLEGGYLQDLQTFPTYGYGGPSNPVNLNTVTPGTAVQFTPYGYYNNGLVEPFTNTNFNGSSGTWASTNPLVMYVNQQGLAYGLSGGTATITYTSPTGVKFSEWIMYVTVGGVE
jgi:GDSL-like Lipase/Acylhydrolase family/Bacterial Ig-like domain (group 2)